MNNLKKPDHKVGWVGFFSYPKPYAEKLAKKWSKKFNANYWIKQVEVNGARDLDCEWAITLLGEAQ